MKTVALLLAGAVILAGLGTARALTAEQKCLSKRATAVGKYQLCVQKQLGKCYSAPGSCSQDRLSKCRTRLMATWPKLQKLSGSTTCTQPRLVDNGATVTDNLTGLVWEKKTTAVGTGMNAGDPNDVDNIYSWTNGDADQTDEDGTAFTDFLAALNGDGGFDGANGWRLPTLAELMTLVNQPYPCLTSPCLDPVFGSTQAFFYWSETTRAPAPIYAWQVGFDVGGVFFDFKTDTGYVRAVRSGF